MAKAPKPDAERTALIHEAWTSDRPNLLEQIRDGITAAVIRIGPDSTGERFDYRLHRGFDPKGHGRRWTVECEGVVVEGPHQGYGP